MTQSIRLLFAVCLALVLGCQRVENADVEHDNVCIDLSPDGKTLVFSSADGDLYLYDVAKSTATRLTDTDQIESYPSFSPDGKQIAFASSESAMAPSRICIFRPFYESDKLAADKMSRTKGCAKVAERVHWPWKTKLGDFVIPNVLMERSTLMRVTTTVVAMLGLWQCAIAHAQRDVMSSHPDGASPVARMIALSHTEALPRCEKIEIFSLKSNSKLAGKDSNEIPKERAFPVRPYDTNAEIVDSVSLTGKAADALCETWRAMAFDKWAGAFCHEPAYGLRFYRDGKLLFETTVCWKCNNFYIPDVDEHVVGEIQQKSTRHQWYGFKTNAASDALLKMLQKHVPLDHSK